MPKDFENCVKAGNKVSTKTLPNGKYMALCKMPSGKWTHGEVHTKKKAK